MSKIEQIESRFKEVTGLTQLDLSKPHFDRGEGQQQETEKQSQKKYGFVTTPIWLVDKMIEPQMDRIELTSRTCDACSGCGQFTVRLMRKTYNKFISLGVDQEKMNKWVEIWLDKLHFFTEFQFSNVAKLVYIFGTNINVYVGDSLNLKYSDESDKGLLFFNEKERKWFNIPNLKGLIEPMKDNLDGLLKVFEALDNRLNKTDAKV